MASLRVRAEHEIWPVAGRFVISRGSRTEAHVIFVEVSLGDHLGRGECVPYPRYGESIDASLAAIEAMDGRLGDDPADARRRLQSAMPPSAARNGLDCALWDLEARVTGRPVHALAGLPPPGQVLTCYTLSLDAPEAMAATAARHHDKPLLKLKLGGAGDDARMRAVRAARPDARLVADANEAWSAAELGPFLAVAAETGVELIEQPLPAGHDDALGHVAHPVEVCADESAHTSADLALLADRYDAVNIKLDKTGGLTEGLAMLSAARRLGFRTVIGCMVSTSLAMAPAHLLACHADFADIDGALLLARDRASPLVYENGTVDSPRAALWGGL
jgi:L-alanine-DL-glutamate epimerase-like enolase superfamily enzyme